MIELFTQTSSGIPAGAETLYSPGKTAVDGNTPFNPSVALILFLVAGGALIYLLQLKRR